MIRKLYDFVGILHKNNPLLVIPYHISPDILNKYTIPSPDMSPVAVFSNYTINSWIHAEMLKNFN